jgi:dTDP-4-amino-4,6-dideoxygalactose transaminase
LRVLASRNPLKEYLAAQGIETRSYYASLLSRHAAFLDHSRCDSLPQAERASREVLSIPCYVGLSPSDQQRVVQGVLDWSAFPLP